MKPVCPPACWVGFVPPRLGVVSPLPPPPDPLGGLWGFRACPAAGTLLGQAQVGSGGLGPRWITGTLTAPHRAVRSVTSHPRADSSDVLKPPPSHPEGEGGAHFPPPEAHWPCSASFSPSAAFGTERFLPFASQLESPGPRSCLDPPGPPQVAAPPRGTKATVLTPKTIGTQVRDPSRRTDSRKRGRTPSSYRSLNLGVLEGRGAGRTKCFPTHILGCRRVGDSELDPAGGAEGAPSFPAHPPRGLAAAWSTQPGS